MCARSSCGDWPSARVPTSCADDGAGSGDGAADWAFAPLPVKSTASTNQHASVEIVAMENPGSTLNAAACAATPLGPIRANTDHHLDHCRTLIPPPEVGRRPTARNSKSGARQAFRPSPHDGRGLRFALQLRGPACSGPLPRAAWVSVVGERAAALAHPLTHLLGFPP